MQTYCPECRTRQPVEGEFYDSHYEGGSASAVEVHYRVEELACGHQVAHRGASTNTAPGAPYVGVPAAASHHPRDLARLREEQRRRTGDPWGES